jgi:pilus assembly protein CpaC
VRPNPVVTIAGIITLSFATCSSAVVQAQAPSAPPASPQVSSQDSTNDLSVAVGKSVLVDFAHPVQRVAVGMSEIAEVSATSPTEVLVDGKTPGQTSLIVWEKGGGRQFFTVTVRPNATESNGRLDAVRREINMELPGQNVKVTAENGTFFLRGTVKDLNSSDRAVQIASTAGKVLNLLYVDVPAAEKQILLKVRFASVDRSKSKQLGLNIYSLGFANTVGGISTGQFSPPIISDVAPTGPLATLTNELGIVVMNPGNLPIGAEIEALETKGVVEVLAEPNLLASNGKQASFLAGGEYPYPVVQGGSGTTGPTVTIMFKEYGVRLNFIPTITPRGTIRLQVAPEVSSLDFTNAIELSGFEVPAISSRRVKTEAELADGQTLIIGGLLDNRDTETFEKVPFLGDIPILGKFFQSMSKNRTNTELIVTVTPEIVDPIKAGEPIPELNYPSKFLPPNSTIPMHTPDTKAAGVTPPPAPTSLPVEKLIESQKPEKALDSDSNMIPSGFSAIAGPAATAPQ